MIPTFSVRVDGSVLLPSVWHEWRDGAFNVWVETNNVKARHLRRDPRATIRVAESDPPLRGVEVRGSARFIKEDVTGTARRIAARYIGQEDAAADAQALRGLTSSFGSNPVISASGISLMSAIAVNRTETARGMPGAAPPRSLPSGTSKNARRECSCGLGPTASARP